MTMSSDRLVRLPDGTWVRPSAVVSVTVLPCRVHPLTTENELLPARVDVRVCSGGTHFILTAIDVESTDAARELCDQIGRIIADAEDDDEEDTDDGRE
jgi:hypothetical protein